MKPAAVKGHFFFCLFFGDTGRFAPDSRSQTVGRRRASVFLPVFRSSTGMWQRARRSRRPRRPLRGGAKTGAARRPREGQAPPLRVGARPFVAVVGAAALGRPRTQGEDQTIGTSRTPSPTGWCEAVRFRRRGGVGAAKRFNHFNINRANPYAGTDSPDAFVMDSFFAARAADSRPYGDGRARCETNTGRRGRRPLRGECEAVGRVRIRGPSRTPSPTGL